jgi:hypothetical protein
MFSALAKNHGDLRNKIDLFVALAPVTNLGATNNVFLKAMANVESISRSTLNSLGVADIFG